MTEESISTTYSQLKFLLSKTYQKDNHLICWLDIYICPFKLWFHILI